MPTPAGPNCAIENVFGVVVGTEYIASNRIGTVPVGTAPSVTSVLVEFINGLALIAGAGQPDWLDTAPAPWTVRTEDAVDPLDSILKTFVYLNWRIDLTKVSSQTLSFQLGYRLNGVKDEFCIYMPGADVPIVPQSLIFVDGTVTYEIWSTPYDDIFGEAPTLANKVDLADALSFAKMLIMDPTPDDGYIINFENSAKAARFFKHDGFFVQDVVLQSVARNDECIARRRSDGRWFYQPSGSDIKWAPADGSTENTLVNVPGKTVEMMWFDDDSNQLFFVTSDRHLWRCSGDDGSGLTEVCAQVNESWTRSDSKFSIDYDRQMGFHAGTSISQGFAQYVWSAGEGPNGDVNLIDPGFDVTLVLCVPEAGANGRLVAVKSDNHTIVTMDYDGANVVEVGDNGDLVVGFGIARAKP